MVQINFGRKEVSCKIVYYGPGMSGKTTNLEIVHQKVPEQNRGDLTSISTDGDRTLFFDYMPLELGSIAGMRTKFQLYTVPGQVYYNSTRKLVLQGADGIVFVADSNPEKMRENLESLHNLEENLREYGKDLKSLPHAIQFNKRDLPDAVAVDEMNQQLNRYGAPTFEAIAATGQGVFPTLKALVAIVLDSVNKSGLRQGAAAPSATVALPAASAQAPAPASPFTRNAPVMPGAHPGGSAARPAAAAHAPAAVQAAASPQTAPGLQPLMSHPPKSAPVPAAPKPARMPLPKPQASGRPRQAPARRSPAPKPAFAYGLVFVGLVLAAATGIVLLLVM